MSDQNQYLKSSKLIATHYGEEYEHYYNAIVPPVFMNSLNVFESLDDYYDFDRRDKHKYCYGRVQNPTVRILEDKIGALEHGLQDRESCDLCPQCLRTAEKFPERICEGAYGYYGYLCGRGLSGGI